MQMIQTLTPTTTPAMPPAQWQRPPQQTLRPASIAPQFAAKGKPVTITLPGSVGDWMRGIGRAAKGFWGAMRDFIALGFGLSIGDNIVDGIFRGLGRLIGLGS
jgi:hypothetical protein